VLYREPMWLKPSSRSRLQHSTAVSVLYREPMWLKRTWPGWMASTPRVSVLYREPMWLKRSITTRLTPILALVSVLYREPMWLKLSSAPGRRNSFDRFSALP